MQQIQPDIVETVIRGSTFSMNHKFDFSNAKVISKGSGVLVQATDTKFMNQDIRRVVAIKRIRPYSTDPYFQMELLREIRLMKLFTDHPNILSIHDLSIFKPKDEIYVIMECMECNLSRILKSKQTLSDLHFKCFTKQLLEGINAIHSVGIVYRQLSAEKILLNRNCQLRIYDFSDAIDARTKDIPMDRLSARPGPHVANRCPEMSLAPSGSLSTINDMWSVGCIIAEMFRRKSLFNNVTSLTKSVMTIFGIFGYHNTGKQELGIELCESTLSYLSRKCVGSGTGLRALLPAEMDENAIQLISSLLTVDPTRRATAKDALQSAYVADAELLYNYDAEYVQPPPPGFFDFERDVYTEEELKAMIEEEVSYGGSLGPAPRFTTYDRDRGRQAPSLLRD